MRHPLLSTARERIQLLLLVTHGRISNMAGVNFWRQLPRKYEPVNILIANKRGVEEVTRAAAMALPAAHPIYTGLSHRCNAHSVMSDHYYWLMRKLCFRPILTD